MSNCVFARRRYNTGIPVTIIGYNSMSTLYVTINGTTYTGNTISTDIGVQEATVAVGDTITMYSGNAAYYFHVNGSQVSKTNNQYIYTVPSGVQKIYIVISSLSYDTSDLTGKFKGIGLTDNDSYLMGIYYGSGQATNCYAMFDNVTSKKYYKNAAAHTSAPTTLKFHGKSGTSGTNMPITVNGTVVGTATSTTAADYSMSATGMRVLAIRGEYSSTNGYYLTAKTYF